jgi:fructokinase
MVYCIGESVYDIVFQGDQPTWGLAGGGMLNAAVSLGHHGVKVELLTELGNDKIGDYIVSFLKSSNVGTKYSVVNNNNSTLALAFADDSGNANYQFYSLHPEKGPFFKVPEFEDGDIIMFGSIYSIEERNRANIRHIIQEARRKKVIIYYDPNIRPSRINKISSALNSIEENIHLADIVRGSDEDFKHILGAETGVQAYAFAHRNGVNKMIYTRGSKGATLYFDNEQLNYEAIPVDVISTIGAGDSFNAGIASVLYKLKRVPINKEEWQIAMIAGLTFASEVCGSRLNYIAKK